MLIQHFRKMLVRKMSIQYLLKNFGPTIPENVGKIFDLENVDNI
jgi:hypothetical protein